MRSIDTPETQAQTSAAGPQPSPARILDTLMNSHYRADALKAAIDLDVFTALAEGCRTAETLAERCTASPRGMRTLCDFLVVNGFLQKNADEYQLTSDTRAFLDKRSRMYFGTVAQFVAGRHSAERSATVLDCVRKGSAVSDMSDRAEEWVTFANAMLPLAAPTAALVANILDVRTAGPIRVLDVAASHGEFGLAIARENPQARIVALDFGSVVIVAERRAREAGVAERYAVIEGSAFDVDLGGPYDIVLLPNFLHHFPAQTIEAFLRKVARALTGGGRVAIVEFVPNDDRVSPPVPAMFSLTMLTNTTGDAYTFTELEGMLRQAGFSDARSYPALPTPQTIIIARRS